MCTIEAKILNAVNDLIKQGLVDHHKTSHNAFYGQIQSTYNKFDWLKLAVTCYSSVSKSQSQYQPFRFVLFLTRAQSPLDPCGHSNAHKHELN